MNEILNDFRKNYGVPEPGSTVLCACSGGADSTALLHILISSNDLHIVCAHYNHHLRGTESDRDEMFVQSLCQNLSVRFVSGSGDVASYARENGVGIEEAAREMRYRFLFETADSFGCSWIATAHNAEDNAETVLMNLIRGSGLKGLSGIPPIRDSIIRPLLATSRSEILAYLKEHRLPHVEDSSNEADDYSRNRIRHHVIPFLMQQNPAAVRNITSSSSLLREDEAFLLESAESFLKSNCSGRGLSVSALLSTPKPVGSRALRILCNSLERDHIDAIYSICRGNNVHASLSVPGANVHREYDWLAFNSEKPDPIPETELVPGTDYELGEWHVECRLDVLQNEIYNSFNTFYFKSEKLCGKITFASRKEGAKIRLAGRNCTKTLKKLFAEAKLPLAERTHTPVLYDREGVIAVYGFGIAERCKATLGDSIIRVTISKGQKG